VITPEQQTFAFPAPQRAVAPSRRNLVLEAGAGTGKTTAIVAEVLKLLLGDSESGRPGRSDRASRPITETPALLDDADVAPERIVLVTFTEKAAGEIADRIESALTEIHLRLGDEAVRWPIGSDRPLLEVRAEQRQAVERQMAHIDGLRSQTIHSFCQMLLRQYPIEGGVDPQFRVIEGFDRSLLYGQIYDAWIDDETRLHPRPQAEREWEALLDHCGYLFLARNMIFALIDRRHLLLDQRYDIGTMEEYEDTLAGALQKIRAHGRPDSRVTTYVRATATPPAGSGIDTWIDFFAPIAADLREADLRDEDRCREAIRTLRNDKKGSSVYDLLISHRAAAALLALTRRFIAWLDEEKRKRGVVDFDDLLIRTRALLTDASIVDRIRQQFDFIFVDEFQDTDRIQAEIIERLARDRTGAYVAGKTVVVGDPKQSIYAFRRADPETYDRFTQSMTDAGGRRELLADQHRSDPRLVDALNAIGAQLFSEGDRDPNVFRPSYHPLRAAKSVVGTLDAPITLVGCDPEQEAEAIVSWIGARRESDLRKFALLFRRRTKIDRYLDVFDRSGLPYVLPPMGLFLDRPAPVDLLAVLRAIAYRYDRGAAISAARTPYFALTDLEIATGILGETPAYQSFEQAMDSFREAARQLTVTELIDHVVKTTGIEAVYRATADGTRSLRHLEQVRTIAFAYDQKAGGSVRQFVEEIARRRDVPEEVEPSLLDETSNAVRILTIHAAKGLEFETVILPDIEFQSSSRNVEFFTVDDPPSLVIRNGLDTLSGVCRRSGEHPLREIATLRDEAETRRLFYVAITRARSDVAIVCNPAKTTKNGFGRYLREIIDVHESLWPSEPGRVVRDLAIGRVAFERIAPTTSDGAAAHVDAEPLAPCVIPQPEPIVAELSRAEVAIARAGAPNRAAGIVLHRVLERWDWSSEVEPLLRAIATEQAADDETVALVRRRLATAGGSEMFRRIARAETIGREMPISFVDENGALVQKRIDRLIREDGVNTVIDYKSGAPSEERLLRDREQVALYCRAVERLLGGPCRGVLWYIDTENDRCSAGY
jgi:ATP-dependent helicase/nuclease subunit A